MRVNLICSLSVKLGENSQKALTESLHESLVTIALPFMQCSVKTLPIDKERLWISKESVGMQRVE